MCFSGHSIKGFLQITKVLKRKTKSFLMYVFFTFKDHELSKLYCSKDKKDMSSGHPLVPENQSENLPKER